MSDVNNINTDPKTDSVDNNKSIDTNLTISTKLSTDQLICKTPQESPSVSVKSLKDEEKRAEKQKFRWNPLLYLGILQVLFGLLMAIFGVLVILHKASLAQFGAGIWGGSLAMATGVSGILAAAKTFCPLKSTAQTVAHTVYLALSLISLAISQLVVVIAATGLARDINSPDPEETKTPILVDDLSASLPANYQSLLANIGLLMVASIECICAAAASYRSARDVCPCFRRSDDNFKDINMNHSHALVASWLGKHNGQTQTPQFYVVAAPAPSTLGRVDKMSSHLTPVFAIPPPVVQPQVIGYPLIPAPLGPVPSPIIPPPTRREMMYKLQKKYRMKPRSREPTPRRSRSRSRSKSTERTVSDQDVARTYTGLDRTIAEEFIDILDSKNTSLCSDYSCTSSSSCQSPSNDGYNNSDAASQDYLVNKI